MTKNEVLEVLTRMAEINATHMGEKANRRYEIAVDSLCIEWGSFEETLAGIIWDNIENPLDEIFAIVREKRIEYIIDTPTTFSVVFDGFKTEQQALEFAKWYSGQGEQMSDDWMQEHTKISGVYTDSTKIFKNGGFRINSRNTVRVPIKIIENE